MVFHVQFIPIILKILKCICIRCSKLLIDINSPEIQGIIKNYPSKKRFNMITERCSKIKICGTDCENGCGAVQPNKYVKEGLAVIYAEWKDKESRQNLNAEFIQKIFQRISDEECESMGLSPNWCRPEWLICEVFVPPPASFDLQLNNLTISVKTISHKLVDILKTNNHLKRRIMKNREKS